MPNFTCPLTLIGGVKNKSNCIGDECGLYTPFKDDNPTRSAERRACELIWYLLKG
jgi:hypothetical protein